MSPDLLALGLSHYAGGDFEAAARSWLDARRGGARDPRLDAYLSHLRTLAPGLLERLERELTAPSPAAPPLPPVARSGVQHVGADPWGGDVRDGPAVEVHASGTALRLVDENPPAAEPAPSLPASAIADMERSLRELAELDDFSGMLAVAHELLHFDASNPRALAAAARSREMLTKMYASEVGDLAAVPVVRVSPDQIIWLDLDHRAGFVLAQVDGRCSYADIVAIAGLKELESLAILAKLVRDKVIGPR